MVFHALLSPRTEPLSYALHFVHSFLLLGVPQASAVNVESLGEPIDQIYKAAFWWAVGCAEMSSEHPLGNVRKFIFGIILESYKFLDITMC